MATATPATARRNEPLQPNIDSMHSPLRSTHHAPARTSTPRPSISPLSTASKPAKSSPIATRDATMDESEAQEDAEANPDPVNTAADTADLDDSRSSSLSEPEDDDEDDAIPPYMSGGRSGITQLTAQQSVDVDSEAETERLEETPQKLRMHADSIGRTPSKLNQAAVADDELSDPPSPLPMGAGAASSTSTIAAGLKRKRSDPEDSPLTSEESDIGESPRKRSHESPLDEAQVDNAEANGVAEAEEQVEARASPVANRETPSIPHGKGAKGKKGKQKGRKPKEQVETPADAAGLEDGVDVEQDPGEETAQKSKADLKVNGEASSTYEDLAKQFQAFREQLVNERLVSIDNELQLLHQPDCLHPEYLRQAACIDERRAKQQREAHAFYAYKSRSIMERTLGERTQLHSQYFQHIREQREVVLDQLGEDWYSIQRERRTQHQESDDRHLYKFPAKRSTQVRQAAKYNQEVSVLSGVAKYVGFPAAPAISGAEGNGLDDDLKAMKLIRRVQQPAPHTHHHHQQAQHQQPQQQPSTFQANAQPAYSERRAHEQFLEQNAWARPQQSAAPAHGTPNLTHTTDWFDQPTGGPRHLMRNLSAQGSSQYGRRTGSPFATPVPTKRAPAFPNEHPPSDGPEIPSSVIAAPPTEGRLLQHGQNVFASSPLQVAKHRNSANGTASRQPHHQTSHPPERELTGFRNISNVSGTSTIDAPLSAKKHSPNDTRHEAPSHDATPSAMPRNDFPPGPGEPAGASVLPHQAFETSALHRHPHLQGVDMAAAKGAFAGSAGFRPAEGTFGTPAPLGGSV